jgi:hypothetical protein
MRRLLPATFLLAFTLAACGGAGDGSGSGSGNDTLTLDSQAPADTADIRDEMLTPATLSDPRIEALDDAERRILQDYVNRGVRRDSLEDPGSRNLLGGWLDSNLTVGQVIALYRSVEEIEPIAPEQLGQPDRPPQQSPTRLQEQE